MFKHGQTVQTELFYNKLYKESRKHILMDDYIIQGNMSALGNILCLMKFFLAIVVDLIE